ncbi:MAG: hypothetical protein MUP85_04430, partial [Candidatus Lokiarchaeota archaeon]|nr:hypothetical protein [Candidatus Lokiarchaeota archaeon]
TVYGYGSASGIGTNPEIMIPSAFAIFVSVVTLFTLIVLTYYLKQDIRNFNKLNLRYILLINAVILIIPIIAWIIQFDQASSVLPEEIIEMGYESIWEIFTPSLGLIGVFICSGIILAGISYIQFNYLKILEKLLPTVEEKRKELSMVHQNILRELNQIKNEAKNRYLDNNDSILLETLTKEEIKKYKRLNQRLDKLSSVLEVKTSR